MKRYAVIVLAGLLALLTACGDASVDADGAEIQLYYSVLSTVNSGAAIASETAYVEELSVECVMDALLDGPSDTMSFASTFPSGTELQSWLLQDGSLALDLSESFGRLSGVALIRAEYCIVLTLSPLDSGETITITVDGQALPGGGSGALSATDVVLQGETEDPVTVGVQLYFPLTGETGLGIEYREFEVADLSLETQANAVLEQLTLGPADLERMSAFLTGANLLEVEEISGTTCTLSLDSATLSCIAGNEDDSQLCLYAIVNSLIELDGIDSVSFQLDGAAIDGWPAEFTANYDFAS